MRIAGEIVIVDRIVVDQRRVLAAEPVAPVIPRTALLGLARDGFDFARVGPEAKVASAHRSPELVASYTKAAEGRGIEVMIGAAGLVQDQVMVAGTYQYNLALSNPSSRPDVSSSQFDFYVRWNQKDWKYWISANPEWIVDHAQGNTSTLTMSLNLGHKIGKTTSIYVDPGVALTNNRAYDWKIEVGLVHLFP